MPGGDTRAAGHHPPYQLTLVRGEGPWLTDLDGHRYLDLIGNFTSLVHGNAYPPIIDAARRAMEDGTNWPARNVHAVALAEEIVARVPSVEQLRFTNSGSEATMVAVEIARVATGRRLVLMARYGYHGSAPHFEVGTPRARGPGDPGRDVRRRRRVRGDPRRAGRGDRRRHPRAGDGLGRAARRVAPTSSWPSSRPLGPPAPS